MPAATACENDNLHRSICMIQLILADVARDGGGVAGGGISRMEAASSTSYTVSLPREERVETWLYEFDVRDGRVSIRSRTVSTKGY